MKLSCPACNESLSLAALVEHAAAREAISLALKMPAPLGKFLLLYLGLFKPAKSALSLDKVANILNELQPMMAEGKVRKNGNVYAAPQEYWAQAIETMLAKRGELTLPLKSHGYLISIIAGFADKLEAKAEKQAEQGRQLGEFKTSEMRTVNQAATLAAVPASHLFAAAGKKVERTIMPAAVKATIAKLTGKPSHAE